MLYLGMDLIIIGYPVRDRLIFIMGIPIPWKTVFILRWPLGEMALLSKTHVQIQVNIS